MGAQLIRHMTLNREVDPTVLSRPAEESAGADAH